MPTDVAIAPFQLITRRDDELVSALEIVKANGERVYELNDLQSVELRDQLVAETQAWVDRLNAAWRAGVQAGRQQALESIRKGSAN